MELREPLAAVDTGLGLLALLEAQTVPDNGRDGGKPSPILFLLAGAWVQVSPSPELQEGQAVVLSCQVPTGVPEGTSYRWYRDGRPLQESTSSTLRIAAISLRQAGTYHCQAQAPDTATASLAAPVSLHVSCKAVSHACGEGRYSTAGPGIRDILVTP